MTISKDDIQNAIAKGYEIAATNFDEAFSHFTAWQERLEKSSPVDFKIEGQKPTDLFKKAADCCTACSILFNGEYSPEYKLDYLNDFQQEIAAASKKGQYVSVARPLTPWADRYIRASWESRILTPQQDAQNREAVGFLLSLARENPSLYFSRNLSPSLQILPRFTSAGAAHAIKSGRNEWVDFFTEQKIEEAAVTALAFQDERSKPSKNHVILMSEELRSLHDTFAQKNLYARPLAMSWSLLMGGAATCYPNEVKKIAVSTHRNTTGYLEEQADEIIYAITRNDVQGITPWPTGSQNKL